MLPVRELDPVLSKYPEDFRKIALLIFDLETDDDDIHRVKVDSGGATRYGISKKAFPSLDVENLTIEKAIEIYYAFYRGSQAYRLLYPLSLLHFNFSFNGGQETAGAMLQRAINSLLSNPDEKIEVDGKLGPRTMAALEVVMKCVPAGFPRLVDRYLIEIYLRYTDLGNRRKDGVFHLRQYLAGWLNRTRDIVQYFRP